MAKPLLALLTDFGTRDHYVAVMKGVALSINPDATLVDLSHDLPAHDIGFASQELASICKYFPAGTVFLVVVDPGVGTARLGIAAEAGDWKFVAPDNGVLTSVLEDHPPKKVVELSERRYARPTVSRTFEGRDRFAPAAAWLSKGIQLGALGRQINDYVRVPLPKPVAEAGMVTGVITRIDHFGNVVTNLDRRACQRVTDGGGRLQLTVGPHAIARIVSTYAEIGPDEVAALFGSTDHLECAARASSAAARLAVSVGDPVVLRRE
jgi:S-adenosylmethionine hydrolase